MYEGAPSGLLWIYPEENPKWLSEIVKEFRIHPITAQILVTRGFRSLDEIHKYLYSKLPDLYDPYLFLDMDLAVQRILSAVAKEELILIYGDNDVDGMTGTALLYEFIRLIGGRIEFTIPNPNLERKEHFHDVLEMPKEKRPALLITVDCGITAAKEIQRIATHGIDVIVTDHHEPTDKIPNCIATLNPKLINQTYPNRDLTGVGVAFKLAHALTNELVMKEAVYKKKIDLKSYLDLVALGTIADMGALLGENRIMVRYGLKQLEKTKRLGLLHLFSICGVEKSDISTIDIASKIAPRLNSLGRIADPKKGVELLLARDEKTAELLANELDLFNLERQKVEQLVSIDVEREIASCPDMLKNRAIVLFSNKWHPGVIPIISARIAKQYNRPTIIIAIDKGIGKGSIRTIREFPLLNVLKKFSDLLLNYGGHDYAAGLAIKEENVEKFKRRFIHAANSSLNDYDIQPKLYVDAKADFKELTYELLSSLELLEPFGNENPQPLLYCEAKQKWPPKVFGGSHLKLYLEQEDRLLEAIAFGMAEKAVDLKRRNLTLKIAYLPQVNYFRNKSSIQLLVKDFQYAES